MPATDSQVLPPPPPPPALVKFVLGATSGKSLLCDIPLNVISLHTQLEYGLPPGQSQIDNSLRLLDLARKLPDAPTKRWYESNQRYNERYRTWQSVVNQMHSQDAVLQEAANSLEAIQNKTFDSLYTLSINKDVTSNQFKTALDVTKESQLMRGLSVALQIASSRQKKLQQETNGFWSWFRFDRAEKKQALVALDRQLKCYAEAKRAVSEWVMGEGIVARQIEETIIGYCTIKTLFDSENFVQDLLKIADQQTLRCQCKDFLPALCEVDERYAFVLRIVVKKATLAWEGAMSDHDVEKADLLKAFLLETLSPHVGNNITLSWPSRAQLEQMEQMEQMERKLMMAADKKPKQRKPEWLLPTCDASKDASSCDITPPLSLSSQPRLSLPQQDVVVKQDVGAEPCLANHVDASLERLSRNNLICRAELLTGDIKAIKQKMLEILTRNQSYGDVICQEAAALSGDMMQGADAFLKVHENKIASVFGYNTFFSTAVHGVCDAFRQRAKVYEQPQQHVSPNSEIALSQYPLIQIAPPDDQPLFLKAPKNDKDAYHEQLRLLQKFICELREIKIQIHACTGSNSAAYQEEENNVHVSAQRPARPGQF